MPLQNRVSPFGELFATSARGTLFGNRGGKFHADGKALTKRRWASRQWICCVLDFKGRQRDVWGRYYTELFFLDEVTAGAPRRNETRATADAMDDVLHGERLDGRAKRTHRGPVDTLPDGAVIAVDGEAFALRGGKMLHWTPQGYDAVSPRPRGAEVDVLTPPSIVAVLARGYVPLWHRSAETLT